MRISQFVTGTLVMTFLLASLTACRRASGPDVAESETGREIFRTRSDWTNSLGMIFARVPRMDKVKMAIWETRVGDFRQFTEATGYDASPGFYYYEKLSWQTGDRSWANPNFDQTDQHPVCGVSWSDAAAFCIWLSAKERAAGMIGPRQAYRLPTDREWTLAAGEDVGMPLPAGYGNYSPVMQIDEFEHTSPVGFFAPNANGYFDLAGNVWEFCLDLQGARENLRVIRGGSWQNWHGRFVGINARGYCSPDIRITLYGFRVVLADDDQLAAAMEQHPPGLAPLPAKNKTEKDQP